MARYPKNQVQIHTIHTKNEFKSITIIIIFPIALQKVTIAPVFTFTQKLLWVNWWIHNCGETRTYLLLT